jgi:hypothetical protein
MIGAAEQCDVVVFLGPSLKLERATTILSAVYLPPAKSGDLLLACRLRPRIIGLIDGYFGHAPSVWHKEILAALDRGIHVFGASSMGALRAAETDRYGMIGVGEIYQHYAGRELTRDDEVALLHAPESLGYQKVSDSLVDIRATLMLARADGTISEDQHDALLDSATATFFAGRDLAGLIEAHALGATSSAARAALLSFARRVKTGCALDQKSRDAEDVLRAIAAFTSVAVPARVEGFHRSTFFLYLRDIKNTRALPFEGLPLPNGERDASAARVLGATYLLLVRLARILGIHNAIGGADSPSVLDRSELETIAGHLSLLDASGSDSGGLRWLKQARCRIRAESAWRWQEIEHRADLRKMSPLAEAVQEESDLFRRVNGLHTVAVFEGWLTSVNLSVDGYAAFMRRAALMRAILDGEPSGLLGLQDGIADRPWIVDAIEISGLSNRLSPRVKKNFPVSVGDDTAVVKSHFSTIGEMLPRDLDDYSRQLDFLDAEAFIKAIHEAAPMLNESSAGEQG